MFLLYHKQVGMSREICMIYFGFILIDYKVSIVLQEKLVSVIFLSHFSLIAVTSVKGYNKRQRNREDLLCVSSHKINYFNFI